MKNSSGLEVYIQPVYDWAVSFMSSVDLSENKVYALIFGGIIILALILKALWYIALKSAIRDMILYQWVVENRKEMLKKIDELKARGHKNPKVKSITLTNGELKELTRIRPIYWPLIHLLTFNIEAYMLNDKGYEFVLRWLKNKEEELKKGETSHEK